MLDVRDLRVDYGRAPLRQHAALVQDHDAFGKRRHHPHHVLDQHDRRALVADAPNQIDGAVDLRRCQA